MQNQGAWGAASMLRLLLVRSSSSSRAAVRQQQQQQHRHFSSKARSGSPECYDDDQHNITAASIPSVVWECLHQLRAAGHEVFLVGGAVRDLLLQSGEPKDYDILTSAQLKQVKDLFVKSHIIGKNFPICQLDRNGIKIEISSMHTLPPRCWDAAASGNSSSSSAVPADIAEHLLGADAAPGRGRRRSVLPHMQQQHATSWAAARRRNAAGRDFTVNALLYDPFQAVLFDYHGGMEDAQQKLLRCVGDPAQRFRADPACLLRAVRCAAKAGLRIGPATAAALQRHAHLVMSLNPQRLTSELTAMLAYGAALPSLILLQQMQLMQHLLPLHHLHSSTRIPAQLQHTSSNSSCILQPSERYTTAAAAAGCDSTTAGSQLGRFLSQSRQRFRTGPLHTEQQGPATVSTQQQQQEQEQEQEQEHCLLFRIAAALDQHASVKQPAPAEVLLACLTAPLLADRFEQALRCLKQLQQRQQIVTPLALQQCTRQQQQQQHKEQQVPELGRLCEPQLLLQLEVQEQQQKQQQQQQQQQQQIQHRSNSAHEWNTHGLHSTTGQQGRIAAAARAFSSNSSDESGQLHSVLPSCPDAAAVAQQLLTGAALGDVLHEQAVQLASQVCAPQQWPFQGSALFGVSSPQIAAGLLATHIALCREHRAQQRKLFNAHQDHAPGRKQLQQQQGRLRTDKTRGSCSLRGCSSSAGSSTCHSTGNARWCGGDHTSLDVDSHMPPPRTNKQYRRLMQAQQQQAAADLMGSMAKIPSPDALLLAAAVAADANTPDCLDGETDGWCAEAGSRGAWQLQQQDRAVVHGIALSSEEYVLHQVLMSAGAGFDALEQAVAELQALQ